MNTAEKLTLIRARCLELLALAEKRTPGMWKLSPPKIPEELPVYCCRSSGEMTAVGANTKTADTKANAAYIAACAGAAEAGWRATIAAIDWIQAIRHSEGPKGTHEFCANILAAWPDELLNPNN